MKPPWKKLNSLKERFPEKVAELQDIAQPFPGRPVWPLNPVS